MTDPASYATRMERFVLSKMVAGGSGGIAEGDESSYIATPTSSFRPGGNRTPHTQAEPPLMAGLVAKKASSFPFGWAPRWCEFFASSRQLLYWGAEAEKAQGTPPRGQRALRSVRLPEEAQSLGGVVLMLEQGSAESRARPLFLRFGSPAERDAWHTALASVLAVDISEGSRSARAASATPKRQASSSAPAPTPPPAPKLDAE